MMETKIGAHEAKMKLPELLRRVEAGERFTITNRGQPVAELRPVSNAAKAGARQAAALMRAFPRVSGITHRVLREMIDEGRR